MKSLCINIKKYGELPAKRRMFLTWSDKMHFQMVVYMRKFSVWEYKQGGGLCKKQYALRFDLKDVISDLQNGNLRYQKN